MNHSKRKQRKVIVAMHNYKNNASAEWVYVNAMSRIERMSTRARYRLYAYTECELYARQKKNKNCIVTNCMAHQLRNNCELFEEKLAPLLEYTFAAYQRFSEITI